MAETEVDVGILMAYIAQLETAILIASDELRAGDSGYAARVIAMMADRITASMEAADRSGAATLH